VLYFGVPPRQSGGVANASPTIWRVSVAMPKSLRTVSTASIFPAVLLAALATSLFEQQSLAQSPSHHVKSAHQGALAEPLVIGIDGSQTGVAKFQGNLTAISAPSGQGLVLSREPDCSLSLFTGTVSLGSTSTYTSTGLFADYIASFTQRRPHHHPKRLLLRLHLSATGFGSRAASAQATQPPAFRSSPRGYAPCSAQRPRDWQRHHQLHLDHLSFSPAAPSPHQTSTETAASRRRQRHQHDSSSLRRLARRQLQTAVPTQSPAPIRLRHHRRHQQDGGLESSPPPTAVDLRPPGKGIWHARSLVLALRRLLLGHQPRPRHQPLRTSAP
jgi:hypothetical protein